MNKISNSSSEEPSKKWKKRQDYIEWDDYFMAMAILEQNRNPEAVARHAAIILNDRKIIISLATSSDSDCDKNTENNNHAAFQAVKKIDKGSVMYTTTFPCLKCAQSIIEMEIKEIIFCDDAENDRNTKELLKEHDVNFRKFIPKNDKIVLDFTQFT